MKKLVLANAFRFTLVELLIVIAVIAILASLLLPALQKARKTTLKIRCMNNGKQTMLAIHSYSYDSDGWLPPGMLAGTESTNYRVLTKILMFNNYLPLTSAHKNGILSCPAETEAPVSYGQYCFNLRLFGYPDPVIGGPMHKITQVKKPSGMMGMVDGDATVSNYYTEVVIYTFRINYRIGYYRHSMRANLGYMDGHVATKSQNELSLGPEVYDTLRWTYPEREQ